MIPMPPGCRITYNVFIEIDQLTKEMVEWYQLVGGDTKMDNYYDNRGRKVEKYLVQYGKGKWCYHRADGTGGTRLHFQGEDAAVASLFLIKFLEHVQTHNLKEHEERIAHDKYLSERSLHVIHPAL